jgi:hypothetical protein
MCDLSTTEPQRAQRTTFLVRSENKYSERTRKQHILARSSIETDPEEFKYENELTSNPKKQLCVVRSGSRDRTKEKKLCPL